MPHRTHGTPAVLLAVAVLLAPSTAGAAEPAGHDQDDPEAPAPVVRAARVDAGPALDGRLDDDAWAGAEVATGFVQYAPDPGAPATERTEVRVLYDETAVYVGARMHDSSPGEIVGQLARRDETPYSDWFRVAIDSYHDRRTAFVFGVNPRGVRSDVFLFDDTREDASWDPVWTVETRTDSLGWSAELRIPLSQLRFDPDEGGEGDGMVWGVQFQRVIARREETAYWAPTSPEEAAVVSAFGELRGLQEVETSRRVEVIPYSLTSVTRAPVAAGDPFHDANELAGSLGGDLRLGVTPELTLSATFNPDFGQVEADPSVVNLSAFETRFPEKRPFFVEGADIFRFTLGLGDDDSETLFYSRRIGRRPRGDVPDGAEFSETPDATTILGAAKLSGQVGDGWSVGFLEAVTGREDASYLDARGIRRQIPVEPLTSYAVARIRKDFREGRTQVGAIATATNREIAGPELDFLRSAAYAGGIDARHRFDGGDYELRGYLLGSHIRGSPEAIDRAQRSSARYYQRPDADHLTYDPDRTALGGASASLELMKVAGGHWRFGTVAQARTPGFEVNDLGFQRSADELVHAAFVGYRGYEPGPLFRRWNVNVNAWHAWNFGGERTGTSMNVNGSFQLHSFWSGWMGIARTFEGGLRTTALRGGPSLLGDGGFNGWFGVRSDGRKTVSGDLTGSWSVNDEGGGWSLSGGPGIEVRPSGRMQLSLRPHLRWSEDPTQYLDAPEVEGTTRYLLGGIERKTLTVTARLSYAFTPRLSVQVYAQPFVSAGRYTQFREVVEPRAADFDERFRLLEPGDGLAHDPAEEVYRVDRDGDGAPEYAFDDPDFTFRQLRSNVVLRWEYRPGSALFVVWSQGRTLSDGRGHLAPLRDLDRLLASGGTHTLLVKATYWLGL